MSQIVDAIYENRVFRVLGSPHGIPDGARVRVTIESVLTEASPLADVIGTLPKENADEMRRIIEHEFEQIDPREW